MDDDKVLLLSRYVKDIIPEAPASTILKEREGKTMIIEFYNEIYNGNSIEEICSNIWNSKKGKQIYSDNLQIFLRNLFEAMGMTIIGKKGVNILNLQIKEGREATDAEKQEFNQTIDALNSFLKEVEKKGFLNIYNLLAYGEITNTMRIIQLSQKVKDQIKTAKEELRKIIPLSLT